MRRSRMKSKRRRPHLLNASMTMQVCVPLSIEWGTVSQQILKRIAATIKGWIQLFSSQTSQGLCCQNYALVNQKYLKRYVKCKPTKMTTLPPATALNWHFEIVYFFSSSGEQFQFPRLLVWNSDWSVLFQRRVWTLWQLMNWKTRRSWWRNRYLPGQEVELRGSRERPQVTEPHHQHLWHHSWPQIWFLETNNE